jgi:hypothetical protein
LKEWLKEKFSHLRYRDGILESRELDPPPEHIIALLCEYFKMKKSRLPSLNVGQRTYLERWKFIW